MRRSLAVVALLTVGCGSSNAPTPVTPPVVVVPPVVVPPVVPSMITVSSCPETVSGVEIGFYRQIGCNGFDLPLQAVRRWAFAPKLYIRTIDEAGAEIDQVTLDTVAGAMGATVSAWTAGKFQPAIERGIDSREGVSGWITVKWTTTTDRCGLAQVAVDGGWIQFSPQRSQCACNGSKIYARSAAHELGHALGYYHTDSQADVMFGQTPLTCEPTLSVRELQAVAYQYR